MWRVCDVNDRTCVRISLKGNGFARLRKTEQVAEKPALSREDTFLNAKTNRLGDNDDLSVVVPECFIVYKYIMIQGIAVHASSLVSRGLGRVACHGGRKTLQEAMQHDQGDPRAHGMRWQLTAVKTSWSDKKENSTHESRQ